MKGIEGNLLRGEQQPRKCTAFVYTPTPSAGRVAQTKRVLRLHMPLPRGSSKELERLK
jgi:hypothetical protein